MSWDYVYGTNMQHAFVLARQMLARQSGTKQIIMITDGEPTAHLLPSGEPFFQYPTHPATRDATLAEVLRCTKEGITINTFMLDASRALRHFIEKLAELNKGRAFFTTPETLGDYVLVDFIEHKRRWRPAHRAPLAVTNRASVEQTIVSAAVTCWPGVLPMRTAALTAAKSEFFLHSRQSGVRITPL